MDLQNFKPTYSKETSEEILQWMDGCTEKGPVDLGGGIVIEDIQLFFKNMRIIVEKNYDSDFFSGQMEVIINLKQKLTQGS